MAEKTQVVKQPGEECIATIVEETAITTYKNGIVIYASGCNQGTNESITTTIAFNFDDKELIYQRYWTWNLCLKMLSTVMGHQYHVTTTWPRRDIIF